ncbi:MAG: hypothetical protein AVDCRST_MAG71-607 [uncultured Lysobacter sp.]|uniref:Uncharacterized protein n=1 Tax=uncultured Lysobacter sp. TaxID=271060 RepID=A0A6J4KLY0_9GAMM|nr:MAG: hypothetical protein AVDCRST_MAG71-607 [uncultured Lysobacter sp.]
MGSKDDNLNLSTGERMSSLATSKSSANAIKAEGALAAERGSRTPIALEQMQSIVADWPKAPKQAAQDLCERYGPPHEATPSKMLWYRTGPWARIELTSDEVVHNFPTPHTDYLTQYVDYPVPSAKASELLAFDGSVILDRTAGQIGARCDHEAYNTLTLNLAVEIIQGTRTVEDARRLYGETAAAYAIGRDAPYAERLLFTPPAGETGDPDEAIIASHMARQAVEKVKDVFGRGSMPH